MKANDYQLWTERTAQYPKDESVIYTTIGLSNEAGELLGQTKKMIRDDNSILTEERKKKMLDETSDCAWYLARICTELGITLEELFDINFNKLEDRLARNVIKGSGDNR